MENLGLERRNVISEVDLRNTIVNADCIDFMRKIPDKIIDACVTDPPYGISVYTHREKFKDVSILNDDIENYEKLMDDFFPELFRIMKNNSCSYIFCGGFKPIIVGGKRLFWTPYDMTQRAVNAGFIPLKFLIWDKANIGLGWKYRPQAELIIVLHKSNPKFYEEGGLESHYIHLPWQMEDEEVLVKTIDGHNTKKHITQKPVQLYRSFIVDSSRERDIVIDPFAGSGPVIEACRMTNRFYLAIEKELDYIPLMKDRQEKELTKEFPVTMEKPPEGEQLNLLGGGDDDVDDSNVMVEE